MKDQYHHGNLKQDLIENAIQIISEYGFEQLSLRGLAQKCGVSHNAVYRHFDNKEQLIDVCRSYVTHFLTGCLNQSITETGYGGMESIQNLAETYICFYQEHPAYYSFLYRNSSMQITLTLQERDGNYPPFEIFRKACYEIADRQGISEEESLNHLIQLWSVLHGLTALLISPKVEWSSNWRECLKNFLKEIYS